MSIKVNLILYKTIINNILNFLKNILIVFNRVSGNYDEIHVELTIKRNGYYNNCNKLYFNTFRRYYFQFCNYTNSVLRIYCIRLFMLFHWVYSLYSLKSFY